MSKVDVNSSEWCNFTDNPPLLRRWHPLRDVFLSKDIRQEKIGTLCQTCHSLAGKGSLDKDHLLFGMNVRKLVFKNSTYNPVNVEMLWYVVYETGKTKTADMHYHYLIDGLRSGCVYYVTPAKEMRQFHLDYHICGVPTSLLTKSKVHEAELVPDWYFCKFRLLVFLIM